MEGTTDIKSVLIVGAGIGGLTTALRLVKKGYRVQIVEKNNQAGGRVNQLKKDGFTFDTGPSFFSMSYEFKQFADECGIELPFRYREVDPLYTVNFSHSPLTYHLYKDIHKLAEQFAGVEPDFEEKMNRYLAKSRQLFDNTMDIVVKQNFDSFPDYVRKLTKVNPLLLPILFRNFWGHVSHYFTSAEARQIVSLVAFFLGRTPFDTNAVYSILSYTEFKHDGYFNVEGGMYKIIEGLVGELNKAGVNISYQTEICGFEETNDKQLAALLDQRGKRWTADRFVINSDAAYFRGKVFNRKAFSVKKLDKMTWTMGAMTMYIGINGKLPQVHLHNYYLGNNFREYAGKVFKNPGTMEKPYFYVNVISRHNPDCAPPGAEALLFVIPVPDLRYKKNWDDKELIADSVLADFSARIGQDIRPLVISRTIYTPEDWEQQFNLYQGSGLGLAHSMTQVGGLRPRNFDELFSNVFYVGASTVPGTGLPMAVISSKLVTERLEKSNDISE